MRSEPATSRTDDSHGSQKRPRESHPHDSHAYHRARAKQRGHRRRARNAVKGLLVGAMLLGGATHAKPKAHSLNGHRSKKSHTVAEVIAELPVAQVFVNIDSFAAVPPYLAYDDLIAEAAEAFGLDAELIHAVIRTESGFNPLAVSPVGAQGLMQLMPALQKDLGVTDPFDPRQNIMAGAKYLKRLLEKHDGDVALALACYNAGPGNVAKYKGIPPFKETQNYVKKITRLLDADAATD